MSSTLSLIFTRFTADFLINLQITISVLQLQSFSSHSINIYYESGLGKAIIYRYCLRYTDIAFDCIFILVPDIQIIGFMQTSIALHFLISHSFAWAQKRQNAQFLPGTLFIRIRSCYNAEFQYICSVLFIVSLVLYPRTTM